MGFAAGVMIAASFWSLLQPSIEYAETSYGSLAWFPAAIGFLAGGFFLRLIDTIVPHLHMTKEIEEAESIHRPREKKLSKTTLLFLAITIHNFPEGLAVGVAFGALASNPSPEAFIGAVGLAIGIGLQNILEGAALSIPIRTDGKSRLNAFYWGSMSAIVEPVGALLGAVSVLSMTAILPYALSFPAGAMIFVVVEELIPDSQTNGNTDVATLGLMVGFVIMMIWDKELKRRASGQALFLIAVIFFEKKDSQIQLKGIFVSKEYRLMVKIKFKKKSKRMMSVIALALLFAIGISLFYVNKKLEEKQRNREYEVSLVKTLKNSYEGIEEIEILNPSYSSIPSDAWGAEVKLTFVDGTCKKHELAYDKKANKIRSGIYHNEDEEFQRFMDSRKGTTKSGVKIRFSDGSVKEQ